MARKESDKGAKERSVAIGISERTRAVASAVLETVLADEVLLYVKTRNFHWNVVGRDFSELHKFFEAQYEALDEIFDDVAERIRSLGARAPGSMSQFLRVTRLSEESGAAQPAEAMLGALLKDHENLARLLRADIEKVGRAGDVGTEDFLTGLLREHEKMAWMLRSYGQ